MVLRLKSTAERANNTVLVFEFRAELESGADKT